MAAILAGPAQKAHPPRAQAPSWTTAVDPKPLSPQVLSGLEWIVAHQDPRGGWSQGEESPNMRSTDPADRPADVGDTAAALLALVRSGSNPSQGPHAGAILKGLEFILGNIEESDQSSLSITDVNGTRLQAKLGPSIDTFLASIVLSETLGRMPDAASEARLEAALDKVLHKIQVNQQADGMWGGHGWAPALADAMAVKGLNRASQAGADVIASALENAQRKARQDVDRGLAYSSGKAAGVQLYSAAFNLSTLQDSVNTNAVRRAEIAQLAAAGPQVQREEAQRTLADFARTRAACESLQQSIIERLDEQGFIAGFGSNGGEEFLSYMNISESLVVHGGEAWRKWDEAMTRNLERIQNSDGSWTGHHCITGRTFCTASALLVLMGDRTPIPVEVGAAAASPAAGEAP
jgi:hypothetical protein